MSWELWRAKGDSAYPWRLICRDVPNKLIQAKHVDIKCLSETYENLAREGSHPPPCTVVIFGSPESDSQFQNSVVFKGAVL